jgi:hypothetical protein
MDSRRIALLALVNDKRVVASSPDRPGYASRGRADDGYFPAPLVLELLAVLESRCLVGTVTQLESFVVADSHNTSILAAKPSHHDNSRSSTSAQSVNRRNRVSP